MSKATDAMKMANTKHGYSKVGQVSPTYRIWQGMKKRCYYPSHDKYAAYGGRGISVCDRWMSFEHFLADMGERPEGRTLERIDNNGNYEPLNCRWASKKEQANNRRSSRFIDFRGERKTLSEWCGITGVNVGTAHSRL